MGGLRQFLLRKYNVPRCGEAWLGQAMQGKAWDFITLEVINDIQNISPQKAQTKNTFGFGE